MPQQDVELILTRQWASYLAVPVWVMGADGELLYFNEAAELLVGVRFDEAGAMPLGALSSIFEIRDLEGAPVPPEALPLGVALSQRRPAHRPLQWRGLDGVWRTGEVTAFPLQGEAGRHLGAIAIFWGADEL